MRLEDRFVVGYAVKTPGHRLRSKNRSESFMRPTGKLKEIMKRRAAVIVPGAANAMFGRAIEDLGFEAVYATGAGIANMELGTPDIGLTTMTEIAETVGRLASA